MKKVLITGGAGFIGSNLALSLLDRGYDVVVLDNLSPQIHGEDAETNSSLFLSIKDKVIFYRGDIRDRSLLEQALKGVDVVVHYAAETGTGQSMYAIQNYCDVNVGGTALLLDILANSPNQVSKVVVASSRSIYGEGKYENDENSYVYPSHRVGEDMDNGCFEVTYSGTSNLKVVATDEDSKIHPSSVYGISKQVQEQLVMTVCPSIGKAGVALRYQNVYGPGQSLKNPYTGILSIFSTSIRNGNGINIFEDGKESRDFVYISDVVEATILAIEKPEANNEVFNVGTGIATTVVDVAEGLTEAYGIKVPIQISGNYRLGDIRHNFADLSKIKQRLGFEPKISFSEGLSRFTKWVKTQDIAADTYMKSIEEMKAKGLYK
ncbi:MULTISPECIES: NAD(P)-dependent oxidoreductase [unclassified Sphingobacterium]|uniref:NAD-dependent epimerase/dehydratase family protein n=1 Tax=unclassified Sphingobacterium TaxID=2609468 RepID=UPI0025D147DD|nr:MULTISPECIES: SDR family NAD(P)-dependent oxidoreductase [unclassified Sphingobacterium]